MKKLMIAAAVMLAAIASNAAAFDWTITNLSDTPDTAAAAGWKVYYMAASTYDGALAAMEAGTILAYAEDNYRYTDFTKVGSGRNGVVGNSQTSKGSYVTDDYESGFCSSSASRASLLSASALKSLTARAFASLGLFRLAAQSPVAVAPNAFNSTFVAS